MTQQYPKRLIEVDLPIKRISAHARREKSIRHGHISTLHIWWARRPLAACRAVLCASLWPDPADPLCPEVFRETAKAKMTEWVRNHLNLASEESWSRMVAAQKAPALLDDFEELRRLLLDFIADFANWDNSTSKHYLETARILTKTAHESMGGIPETPPLAIDPFAGGGAIPLEALRVGADSFASDLNPVAVLLNKVVLEYIPQFGERLANGVRKWGESIIEKASSVVDEYYPKDPNGDVPVSYLWARTIKCEGPGCGVEIPLIRGVVIAQRGRDSVFLRLVPDNHNKQINIEVHTGTPEKSVGTVKRSSADCPCCGYTTPASRVREQFKERSGGANDARLLAVVALSKETGRKIYRQATQKDLNIVERATYELQKRIKNWKGELSLIPTEELPYLRSIFNIHLLGVTQWSDLFTQRQLLVLTTLWQVLHSKIADRSEQDSEFTKACASCAALAIDRLSAQYTSLSWWQPKGEFVVGTFGRQALGIIWDFAEIRPVRGASGDLDGAFDWVVRVISDCLDGDATRGQAELASATQLPLPDDSVAALVTDPPYYDAVPYADLSDFFYTQLRRMLLGLHPGLFAEELTQKKGEIVQLAERNTKYAYKTKEYFETLMEDALADGRRVLSPNGISVIVFAHKTTDGWETILSALVNAGWIVTASWPIDTERAVRMRAQKSAALGSSVHLVCRPRENPDGSLRHDEVGDWRDVLQELPQRIHSWMPRLADEGVVGADAIFACLGPALEIFSRYSRVEKADGTPVMLRDYLEQVWAAVSKEALNMVFQGADASGFEEDARLTAMWLWTLAAGANGNGDDEAKEQRSTGYAMEYDAARKIAQGLGVHMEDLSHLVEVKGDQARILAVAERTKHLFGKDEAQTQSGRGRKKAQQADLFEELKEAEAESGWGVTGAPNAGETILDRIHQSMILFAANRGEALKRFLVEEGAGRDPHFWRLAQALSALYPAQTDEKRWVDGVLARKKGLGF